MTHPMNPIAQAVTLLVADKDNAQVWGPPGGPVLSDGTIALRVSQMANTSSGTATPTQVASDNSDNQATAGAVCLLTQNRGMLWAPTAASWQRVRAATDAADSQASVGEFAALTVARNQVYNRSKDQWDRISAADVVTQQSTDGADGVQVVAQRASEALLHAPAAATQATITKAGVAGGCIVVTGIQASIVTAAAASGIQTVRLVDGAAAVLWSMDLQAAVTSADRIQLTGLNIVVAQDQGVTLSFAAAGPAGSVQKVNLQCHVAA